MAGHDRPDDLKLTDEGEPAPLLLTAQQAAALCGRTLRTWRSWDAAGYVPRPVRVGRSLFWRSDELRAWIDAGCPRRDVWSVRN